MEPKQRYSLDIAGLRLALVTDEPNLFLSLDEATDRFLVADTGKADALVGASWADLSADAIPGALLFDSGALWRLYQDGDGYFFRFATPFFGDIPYKTARFTPDFATGEVLLHAPYFPAPAPFNPLPYPLDELILLNLLARGRGAELHSCGLIDSDGSGYLFLGQSTAPMVVSMDRVSCSSGPIWRPENSYCCCSKRFIFLFEKIMFNFY